MFLILFNCRLLKRRERDGSPGVGFVSNEVKSVQENPLSAVSTIGEPELEEIHCNWIFVFWILANLGLNLL